MADCWDTSYYNHPGIAVTASSGDNGYGVEYPAASRYVTAVGGTSLTRASNSRGWSEVAWSGAGSGCSAV
jgi:subtilase family serine protease